MNDSDQMEYASPEEQPPGVCCPWCYLLFIPPQGAKPGDEISCRICGRRMVLAERKVIVGERIT